MSEPVWVLTVRALAGPRNSVPDGRRYDILAFARGADEDAALAAGRAGLSLLGWDEPEIVRTGEITDPAAVPDDLRGPMERAQRDGCALVVYDG
jgi:hypothetical protein